MTLEISDIKSGRWGLSRITQNAGFSTHALDQRLADNIQVFYPPFNPVTSQYHIDCALVRLQGNIQPTDSNTVLFPRNLAAVGDVALSELTAAQRTAISNVLTAWLPAYSFTDYDESIKNKTSFQDHILTYTGQTTLKEVARDIYRYFGHSKSRPRTPVIETHNTLYTDDFGTDPASRWTTISSGYAWDSTNFDLDLAMDTDNLVRYNTSPGSIEHEAQATFIGNSRSAGVGVRVHNSSTFDGYIVKWLAADSYQIERFAGGTRTVIAFTAATGLAAGDFYTVRGSAEGANGENVVIRGYFTDHNSTSKPSDPDWIGDVGTPTPDIEYTDTDASRLDDSSVHLHGGAGGRSGAGGADHDTQMDWFKVQAISDRAGAAASSNLMLLGVG